MIDENTLDRWEETLRPAITGTFPADDARELVRLARLGLWAEKVAIPLLRYRSENECYVMCSCDMKATDALSVLPAVEVNTK